jgi:hypothetical protein
MRKGFCFRTKLRVSDHSNIGINMAGSGDSKLRKSDQIVIVQRRNTHQQARQLTLAGAISPISRPRQQDPFSRNLLRPDFAEPRSQLVLGSGCGMLLAGDPRSRVNQTLTSVVFILDSIDPAGHRGCGCACRPIRARQHRGIRGHLSKSDRKARKHRSDRRIDARPLLR